MHMYQVYVCDKCGFESTSHDDVELCEARHLGLTNLEDKHTYDALKGAAAYYGSVVLNNKNERTEEAHDNAIRNLLEFEKIHGIRK